MPKVKTLRKHRTIQNAHPYKTETDLENEQQQQQESGGSEPQEGTALSRGQKKRIEKHNRVLRKQGKLELEGFKTFSKEKQSLKGDDKANKASRKVNEMLSELEASLMETSANSEVIKPAAKVSTLSNKSKHQIAVRESAR
jgi:hypothetical protein